MDIKNKLNRILSDSSWTLILLFFGFFCWLIHIDLYVIPILAIFLFLVCFFCDDLRNLYSFFLALPSLINRFDTKNVLNIIIVAFSFLTILSGIIYYIVKQLKRHKDTKKGAMFYAFIALLVSHLIGGLFKYFNFLSFFLIIFFTCFVYFIYWSAINFGNDIKRYFRELFVSLGILLFLQLFVCYLRTGKPFLEAILERSVYEIGFLNINNVALNLVLAMLCVFEAGFKKKYDYLYSIGAFLFLVCIYFTYSRTALALALVFYLIGLIVTIIYSKNKPIFLFTILVGLVGAYLLILFKYEKVSKLLGWYIEMGFSGNGREELWPWCWDRFLSAPLFGVGFVSKGIVPTVAQPHFIMAHNTVLQYLTSLGIIGTAIVSIFYLKKYQIMFSYTQPYKAFTILMQLMIEFWGLLQPPVISPMIMATILLLIVISEKENEQLFQINSKIKQTTKEKESFQISKTGEKKKKNNTNLEYNNKVTKKIIKSNTSKKKQSNTNTKKGKTKSQTTRKETTKKTTNKTTQKRTNIKNSSTKTTKAKQVKKEVKQDVKQNENLDDISKNKKTIPLETNKID